jgi:hypothetical protein
MPVVSIMRVSGDPDALAAGIRDHITPVAEKLAEKHGGLLNVVARTDDGLLLINLWQTDEGRHAMAEEPEIQAALSAAGFPAPHFEGYDVLAVRKGSGLEAALS